MSRILGACVENRTAIGMMMIVELRWGVGVNGGGLGVLIALAYTNLDRVR